MKKKKAFEIVLESVREYEAINSLYYSGNKDTHAIAFEEVTGKALADISDEELKALSAEQHKRVELRFRQLSEMGNSLKRMYSEMIEFLENEVNFLASKDGEKVEQLKKEVAGE